MIMQGLYSLLDFFLKQIQFIQHQKWFFIDGIFGKPSILNCFKDTLELTQVHRMTDVQNKNEDICKLKYFEAWSKCRN